MIDYLSPEHFPQLEALVVNSKAETSLKILHRLRQGADPTELLAQIRYIKFINDAFNLLKGIWLDYHQRRETLRVLLNHLRYPQATVQPVGVLADRQLSASGQGVLIYWQDVIGFDDRVNQLIDARDLSGGHMYRMDGGGPRETAFHPSAQGPLY